MTDHPTPAQEAAGFAAFQAVHAALGDYVEGARTGSSRLMRQAFLDSARIQGSYGGAPADWTLDEFCARIDKNGPAAEVEAQVVSVEIMGTAAMARLEARNWRGFRYTDFFVLLEREGRWRIASKVFYAHAKA